MPGSHSTLKIGLIGFGGWATNAYVPALRERDDVEIVALAARTEPTRLAGRSLLGDAVRLYDNYHDLLGDSAVDTVMIGLPSESSTEAASASLDAGKHIFIEPPFRDGASATSLLNKAERSSHVFHVDLELRYLPVLRHLRDMAERGDFGTLMSIEVRHVCDWSAGRDPALSAMAPGLSTWYIDAIDAVAESATTRVELFTAQPGHEVGRALFQLSNGATSEWAFDLRSPEPFSLTIEVTGSEGAAFADLLSGEYRYRTGDADWTAGVLDCSRPTLGFVGMRESVHAFLDAVLGNTPTISGPSTYRRIHAMQSALPTLD
jgi:predicted dehydrogenase